MRAGPARAWGYATLMAERPAGARAALDIQTGGGPSRVYSSWVLVEARKP